MIDIKAEQAQAKGLPRIGFRVDLVATALSAHTFPEPDKYLIASGPPGGPLLAIVWGTDERTADAPSIERAVRKQFSQPWQQPLEIGGAATVTVGAASCAALAFATGQGLRRTAWCGVIVKGQDAALLVTLGRALGAAASMSCADVLAEPSLAAFTRTFALLPEAGVDVRAESNVEVTGWAAALRSRASLHRAHGALLGLAVGDALGTTHEFKTLDAPPFPDLAAGPLVDVVGGGPFRLVAGQVTDDTQMAIALADVFASGAPFTSGEIAARYNAWKDVAFDVGVQIGQVLDLVAAGTPADRAAREVWEQRKRFPAGNGSLMRTAVIGVLLAGAGAQARRAATFLDGAVTHVDPRCQLACAAFNAAIAHALTERASPASMLRAARAELVEAAAELQRMHADLRAEIEAAHTALAMDLDAARDDDPRLYGDELHVHRGAGFVRVAFRLAFWHLMHAPDYRGAVIDAANRGGDADTNAAIVGALLGAFHGVDAIPAAWRDRVLAAPGLRSGGLDLHPRTLMRALETAFGTAR